MLIQLNDGTSLDVSSISATEWRNVRRHTGHNPVEFFVAIGEVEIESVEALYWLVQKRNGNNHNIGQMDFPLMEFLESWREAEAAAAGQDEVAPAGPKDQ